MGVGHWWEGKDGPLGSLSQIISTPSPISDSLPLRLSLGPYPPTGTTEAALPQKSCQLKSRSLIIHFHPLPIWHLCSNLYYLASVITQPLKWSLGFCSCSPINPLITKHQVIFSECQSYLCHTQASFGRFSLHLISKNSTLWPFRALIFNHIPHFSLSF